MHIPKGCGCGNLSQNIIKTTLQRILTKYKKFNPKETSTRKIIPNIILKIDKYVIRSIAQILL